MFVIYEKIFSCMSLFGVVLQILGIIKLSFYDLLLKKIELLASKINNNSFLDAYNAGKEDKIYQPSKEEVDYQTKESERDHAKEYNSLKFSIFLLLFGMILEIPLLILNIVKTICS